MTNYWSANTESTSSLIKIIVIGAGPVGVRFVDELKRRQMICHITLFGNEPCEPYNRVQLSHLLSREKNYNDILLKLPTATDDFQFHYRQQHIEKIDVKQQQVVTRQGDVVDYDHLIIATGSHPHIPNIDGINLKGVYTFRNLRDAEALIARSYRSRRTVVVGGGLLGLEAAKALTKYHTEVVLVQHSDRLMNRQLDEVASQQLEQYITAAGIRVLTSSGVRRIIGDDHRVEGVIARDGGILYCDTLLFCTGIKPNIALAVAAGLRVGRGITIDDKLQTSQSNIYAIGECSEHNDQIHGTVTPGFRAIAL